jgi:hypothetical protein
MPALEELLLDSNHLTLVPRTLYEDTTSLTVLSLIDNPIARLPTDLGQVSSILSMYCFLQLAANRFTLHELCACKTKQFTSCVGCQQTFCLDNSN